MSDIEFPKYSDKWFLNLYLKYGSVEETMRVYPESLPISPASFHRLVKKYGLVKSAGRHVSFPETLHFFRQKAFEPGKPLEKVYKKMPRNFQTSLSTLHRIYHYMEKKAVRRFGTALILTSENPYEVLVGEEMFANTRYGKKVGDLSIPMGFSKKDERSAESILRVLQQEVFTNMAVHGELGFIKAVHKKLISPKEEPFMYFDIVDVRVAIYLLKVDASGLHGFSSHKLVNHRFINLNDLMFYQKARAGINEIVEGYKNYLENPLEKPIYQVSKLNISAREMVPNLELALRY